MPKLSFMSEIKTFFRTCPSCGHRFEIRLTNKKLVDMERKKDEMPIERDYFGGWPGSYLLLGETEPVTIDEEVFQYVYECKYCGHEWQEKHQEVRKEK